MNKAILINSETELQQSLQEAMLAVFQKHLPTIIRRTHLKAILSSADLLDFYSLSYKKQQYLRDTGKLSYYKEGKKVLYKAEDVEAYLDTIRVTSA